MVSQVKTADARTCLFSMLMSITALLLVIDLFKLITSAMDDSLLVEIFLLGGVFSLLVNCYKVLWRS